LRTKRPRPHLDDKIITAWNGLMISAFARGAQVLGDTNYLAAATRAAEFVRDKLYDAKTHTLRRSYRGGPAEIGSPKIMLFTSRDCSTCMRPLSR
jgi:uncharacterized protein YyaL (SSP411 family)